MARLTRQEAQALTRETLLATAVEHFLDRGYAAASLDQIAEDAGYSKGAVYSNFKNKDELCAEVLGRIRLTKVGEITAQLGAKSTLDDAVAEFARWAERTIGDQRWTLLEVEFSVRSRHSEDIREKIAAGADQVRGLIAGLVQHLTESNGGDADAGSGRSRAANAQRRNRFGATARNQPRASRRSAGGYGAGDSVGRLRSARSMPPISATAARDPALGPRTLTKPWMKPG
ncbi:AcrR family transcriptional regulator [Rhodococcus erythropolis]|nr:AcrR family transcriptional regulator [Rhodococcus erythropolis]